MCVVLFSVAEADESRRPERCAWADRPIVDRGRRCRSGGPRRRPRPCGRWPRPPPPSRPGRPPAPSGARCAAAAVVGLVLRWWTSARPGLRLRRGLHRRLLPPRRSAGIAGAGAAQRRPPAARLPARGTGSASGDTFALRVPSAVSRHGDPARDGGVDVGAGAGSASPCVALTSVSSFELLYGHTARHVRPRRSLCGTVIAVAAEHWLRDGGRAAGAGSCWSRLLVGLFDHTSIRLLAAGAGRWSRGRRSDREAWRWRAVTGRRRRRLGARSGGPVFLDQAPGRALVVDPAHQRPGHRATRSTGWSRRTRRSVVLVLLVARGRGAAPARPGPARWPRSWLVLFRRPVRRRRADRRAAALSCCPARSPSRAWAAPLALAAVIDRADAGLGADRRRRRPARGRAGAAVDRSVDRLRGGLGAGPPGARGRGRARRARRRAPAPGCGRWPAGTSGRPATRSCTGRARRPRRASSFVAGDQPFDGRVWVLQPDTYAMGVGDLVRCEDVAARHLGDYTAPAPDRRCPRPDRGESGAARVRVTPASVCSIHARGQCPVDVHRGRRSAVPKLSAGPRASTPFRMVSDFAAGGRPARRHRAADRRASSGATASRRCWASPAAARAPPSPGPSSRCSGPTLVIAPNKSLAAQLANEFREFFPDNRVEYFVSYYDYYQPEAYMAASDTYIEKDSSVNDEIDRLRHSATSALLTRRDTIVVASVSCIYGLGSPEEYRDQLLVVRKGEEHDQRSILRRLVDMQYERNDLNLVRGKFRVRGDTIEVHPAYDETAVRIELFGDEVEAINVVDPLTGERVDDARRARRLPGHPLRRRARSACAAAITRIEAELQERLALFETRGQAARGPAAAHAHPVRPRDDAGGRLLQRHRELLGPDRRPGPGEAPNTLLDFFPDDFLVVLDESHQSVPQLHGQYEGDRSRKETLIEHGFRLPSAADNRPLRFEEFMERVGQVVFLSATPGPVRAGSSPARSSSRSCARPAWSTPRSSSSRPRARSTTSSSRSTTGSPTAPGCWSPPSPRRWPRTSPTTCSSSGCGCATCTARSTPSSASRSSATCASASSTCWSASTCCARASTCPRCRWWPSSTPTRRASCAARRRSSRPSAGPPATSTAR